MDQQSSQAGSWDRLSRLKKNKVGVEVGTNMTRKKTVVLKIVYIMYILIFPADFEKWVVFLMTHKSSLMNQRPVGHC